MDKEKKQLEEQLISTIGRDTSSIKLMDKYDGYGEDNEVVYKQLVLLNAVFVRHPQKHEVYFGDLVIERRQGRRCEGDITFTQLKTEKENYKELTEYIQKEMGKIKLEKYINKNIALCLKIPYRLRAQNSGNRTGYGSIWEFGEEIISGTLYGETNDYAIVGVYLHEGIETERYNMYWQQRYR